MKVSPSSLTNIMTALIPTLKEPILIQGRPGIGKTDIIKQVAEELGYKLYISHPAVKDPTDYLGLPFMNEEGIAEFATFSDLKKIQDATEPTLFFMDDFGQASPAVQKACMQLLLERELNGKKISDEVVFIAATNRREDRAGVSGILEPVKSRFTIFELDPSVKDWVNWALNQEWMPIEVIAAARQFPKWLTDWKPNKAIENEPCPRNVSKCGQIYNVMRNAGYETLHPIFAGRMGSAGATELVSYLKVFSKLPSIDEVIMDPVNAKLPTDPDARFALVGAMVSRANDQTFEPLMKYAERMDADFQVLFAKDCIQRHKDKIVNTFAYVRWASNNTDVIL